jgi:hypothetical protein
VIGPDGDAAQPTTIPPGRHDCRFMQLRARTLILAIQAAAQPADQVFARRARGRGSGGGAQRPVRRNDWEAT